MLLKLNESVLELNNVFSFSSFLSSFLLPLLLLPSKVTELALSSIELKMLLLLWLRMVVLLLLLLLNLLSLTSKSSRPC